MTIAAVDAILDEEARRALGAGELRRLLYIEACRLEAIKAVLLEKAIAGENAAAAIYVKVSERLATMLGINAPREHLVSISATIQHDGKGTSTQEMLEAIRHLRGEAEAEQTVEGEAEPDPDKLN